jgi:hypothetical protein
LSDDAHRDRVDSGVAQRAAEVLRRQLDTSHVAKAHGLTVLRRDDHPPELFGGLQLAQRTDGELAAL